MQGISSFMGGGSITSWTLMKSCYGITQRGRVCAESPPSVRVYKTAPRRRNLRHSLFATDDNLLLKPHHVLPQLLLRKLHLGVSQESLSHSRRLLRWPLHSKCERRRWSLLAQQLSDRTWILSNGQETCSEPTSCQPANCAAQQLWNFQLPFFWPLCQDPAKERVFFPLLLPLDPASQCLIDRWPMCPAARDPWAFSLVDIASVLCPVVFNPSALCPAASDLTPCLLRMPNSALCSVLPIYLSLRRLSFFISGNDHAEDPRRQLHPRSSAP